MKHYNCSLMNSIRAGQTKPPFGVSHTVPPAKAPDAYEHFDNRDEGWTAVVLKPRPSQIHNCGGTSTLLIDARLTDRAALDAVAGVYVPQCQGGGVDTRYGAGRQGALAVNAGRLVEAGDRWRNLKV